MSVTAVNIELRMSVSEIPPPQVTPVDIPVIMTGPVPDQVGENYSFRITAQTSRISVAVGVSGLQKGEGLELFLVSLNVPRGINIIPPEGVQRVDAPQQELVYYSGPVSPLPNGSEMKSTLPIVFETLDGSPLDGEFVFNPGWQTIGETPPGDFFATLRLEVATA